MKKILLSALFMSVVSMTAFADSLVSKSGSEIVDVSSLNEIRLIGTLNGDSHNFSCMVNLKDSSSQPYVTVGDLIADLKIWYPGMNVQSIALDTTVNDVQPTTLSEQYTSRGKEVYQDSKIEDLNLTDKSVFFMEYVATPVQASSVS